MSIEKIGHYILGVSWSGNKFRPSDWIERIATAFGSFDASQRLRYNPKVRPVKHEGQRCLFVASSLAVNDPDAYNFIMDFADSNHLQVKNTDQTDLPQRPIELPNVA